MKSKNIFSIAFGASVILFDVLFWKEKTGLNVFLFSGFLVGVMMVLYPERIKHLPVKITLVGTLLTAATVVVNNSILSVAVHIFSMLAFIGFVHRGQLGFIGSAIGSNFLRSIELPLLFSEKMYTSTTEFNGLPKIWRVIKLIGFPALGLFLFFQIYISANSKFAALSRDFFALFDFLSFDSQNSISIGHVMFILLGAILTAMALLPAKFSLFESLESMQTDDIEKKKSNFKSWFCNPGSMIGLKNEFRSALILIGSLNVLLFLVNLVDVRYVWFNTLEASPAILSQYVHEGTWLLILSILLSMGILSFYFRGNLNFFKENIWLKRLSFMWIAQNAVLACSVAARNYQYVDHYGLAYKRIGVGVFLIMTLFGLATMVIKVNEKKSLFYLLKMNGWSVYLVLVMSCLLNWDVLITKYNLTAETKSAIDTEFLIYDVSDKNLFLLNRYIDDLETDDPTALVKVISKEKAFKNKRAGTTWVSWNWPDHRNKKYLK
ncbi:MAG: DUF4173 domain-containing protein [Bacteroidota bacterium]